MPVREPELRLAAENRAGHPPLRAALVERARERVRLGFYDRADVTRALVEALLNELATT
jgi:hypothetical protein